MAMEIGDIVEGKVTGLTNFGAFVELPENKVGMVHISEVSNSFVKEISDFLEKGQVVKVKILNIDDAGKISLSIKRTGEELKPRNTEHVSGDRHSGGTEGHRDGRNNVRRRGGDRAPERRNRKPSAPRVWNGQKKTYSDDRELSFEEKMAKFKAESDEKLTDLKHATESKHGGFSRRGGNKRYS